jgi:hypothetical protein
MWTTLAARVRPAGFNQPRMLDLGATGLDKYGTAGPRLGLLGGRADLVSRIRVTGFEFGLEARQMLYPAVVRTLEQYDPARGHTLIETTRLLAHELRPFIGNRLRKTPTTVQIPADDILDIAMQRGGVDTSPIVPYEAAAALAMLLLQNHGMLMVHFVGVPPGTADLLIKFVPPETLERFGGAGRYARAIDDSLTRLGEMLREPAGVAQLLLGTGQSRLPEPRLMAAPGRTAARFICNNTGIRRAPACNRARDKPPEPAGSNILAPAAPHRLAGRTKQSLHRRSRPRGFPIQWRRRHPGRLHGPR